MGFLDKLLGRKPEGDEAQAAAATPAADTAADHDRADGAGRRSRP